MAGVSRETATRSSRPPRSTHTRPGPVDHDLGDLGVGEEGFEGPEPADLGQHLPGHPGLLARRQQRPLAGDQVGRPVPGAAHRDRRPAAGRGPGP